MGQLPKNGIKIMVCYDESVESKNAVKEAQKSAPQWNTGIDIITTFSRVEPMSHKKVKKNKTAAGTGNQRPDHQVRKGG